MKKLIKIIKMQIHSYLFSIMHLHQYGAFTKVLNKNKKKKTKEQKGNPQCKNRN